MVDKSLSPEIIRLSERLSENPGSKLFVPLAEAYLNSGMRDEALFVLTDGIRKHPNLVSARLMMGKILIEKGALLDAKKQFEEALEINPENIPSLKNLALIDEQEGNYQNVLVAYRKIISIDPTDKEVRALLASLEEKVLPDTEIEAPLSGAETMKLEAVHSESSYGPISEILDDWKDESTLENEAGTTQSDFDELLKPTTRPDGEVEIGQVSEMDPLAEEVPLATPTLAELYMSQGCYQEAVDIYREILGQTPSDLESQEGLAAALAHLKSPGKTTSSDSQVLSARERKIGRLHQWLSVIEREVRR